MYKGPVHMYTIYMKGRCIKGQSQTLFSGAQGQNQRQRAQTQDVPPEHQETLFCCEGDGALALVAQSGCGEYPQKYPKAFWTQSWATGPTWHLLSREVGLDNLRDPFQSQLTCDFSSTFVFLHLYCHSAGQSTNRKGKISHVTKENI